MITTMAINGYGDGHDLKRFSNSIARCNGDGDLLGDGIGGGQSGSADDTAGSFIYPVYNGYVLMGDPFYIALHMVLGNHRK